ncbi:MAG: M20/M25/M40 family metallo-hydrolase [Bacteroidales bacterium]|nr:M20/M25/M40 family metallo-hydrolase [Bacteroidales bacterium]
MNSEVIDEILYDSTSLLKEMISIPSHSREESEVADLLIEHIKNKITSCKVNRIGNNVWVTSKEFDTEKPTILLNSHIDTVKPVEGWNRNPYSALQEEDKLFGLGSNDAGASVVALLAAFRVLVDSKQKYNLIFAASAEEEVSGKNGMECLIKQLPNISFAIVGEPTNMRPAAAEKGLMVLDCVVKGISGHAARNEGVNAIYKAIEIIEGIKRYKFEKVSPLLGEVKLTVTGINAGTQHNVIPDICSFMIDVRPNGMYSNIEIWEILKERFPECEFTPRSTRLNSSSIESTHPFMQRCNLLGLESFGSPTLSDQALIPYTSVKIGPGNSARSHTADEFIYYSEIREAIELYVKLLDGLQI